MAELTIITKKTLTNFVMKSLLLNLNKISDIIGTARKKIYVPATSSSPKKPENLLGSFPPEAIPIIFL